MNNTIKIKTTVTESRQVEKEISLPFYSKKDGTFYKVSSENSGVRVTARNNLGMMWNLSEYEFHSENIFEMTPCTEQEFNEAFEKALDVIKANVGLWITVSPLPQPEDFDGLAIHRDEDLIPC